MIQKIADRLEGQIKENLFELELLDQKRAEKVKSSKEYGEYIKSNEWQETRQRILKRDVFRCVLCGAAKNLQVHHITYENLGEEKDADLVTLCEACHEDVHYADICSGIRKAKYFIEQAKKECFNVISSSNDMFEKEIARAYLIGFDEMKETTNKLISEI